MMQEITTKRLHSVRIDNAKQMTLTGITEVRSFSDDLVLLKSDCGGIEIKGKNLVVQKFDTEEGTAALDGEITCFRYTGGGSDKGGFIKRLFK